MCWSRYRFWSTKVLVLVQGLGLGPRSWSWSKVLVQGLGSRSWFKVLVQGLGPRSWWSKVLVLVQYLAIGPSIGPRSWSKVWDQSTGLGLGGLWSWSVVLVCGLGLGLSLGLLVLNSMKTTLCMQFHEANIAAAATYMAMTYLGKLTPSPNFGYFVPVSVLNAVTIGTPESPANSGWWKNAALDATLDVGGLQSICLQSECFCLFLSCLVLSCLVLSCLVLSGLVLSCLVIVLVLALFCLVLSWSWSYLMTGFEEWKVLWGYRRLKNCWHTVSTVLETYNGSNPKPKATCYNLQWSSPNNSSQPRPALALICLCPFSCFFVFAISPSHLCCQNRQSRLVDWSWHDNDLCLYVFRFSFTLVSCRILLVNSYNKFISLSSSFGPCHCLCSLMALSLLSLGYVFGTTHAWLPKVKSQSFWVFLFFSGSLYVFSYWFLPFFFFLFWAKRRQGKRQRQRQYTIYLRQ